ncbi:hypothetical protein, partial [Ralstonia pseudosolanacearum]|uniref:hypothetical protein n=1 Tax=Ralstonia pseudosolanacearum TaxID=1310165 RepID=UPI001FF9CB4F
ACLRGTRRRLAKGIYPAPAFLRLWDRMLSDPAITRQVVFQSLLLEFRRFARREASRGQTSVAHYSVRSPLMFVF